MLLVLPEEVRLICVLQTYFVILIPLELNMSVIYLHTISEQITYCYSANSGVLGGILPQSVCDCGIGGVWGGGGGGHCPPRSEPIDFVRSMNTKIFSHCLILFALSYFNEYVKA